MRLICIICGFSDETEIISHLNQKDKHHDGYMEYAVSYPDIPVVNHDLYKAIHDELLLGYKCDNPLLDTISREDKEILICSVRTHQPVRSEVLVIEEDNP